MKQLKIREPFNLIHCWQADDVIGFENDGEPQVGYKLLEIIRKARTFKELRSDLEKFFFDYGKHRVSLMPFMEILMVSLW